MYKLSGLFKGLFLVLTMTALLVACSKVSNKESENYFDSSESTSVVTQSEDSGTVQTYIVKTVESKDNIDWDSVPGAKVNNYKWVECKQFDTTAKLVYVKGFGFVCHMTCMESNPVATYTKADDPVYLDSCMEFFASYAGEGYLNIETNSVGATCIQFGTCRADREPMSQRFVEPFVVKAEVEENEWSVTSEIPLDKLRDLYGEHVSDDLFVSGYTFTGNFYKTGGAEQTGNEHYGMWNEVGTEKPDFHQPAYFGKFIIE